MAEFLELEAQDGVRMPWNVFPGTKQEATACVVPPAAIYTPLKPLDSSSGAEAPLLPYAPLRCRICRSVLNPFAIVDYATKIWICPFCYQRNHFPHHYASLSEDSLPAELFRQYTTIEYQSAAEGSGAVLPPVYLFVVDTCMIEEEVGYLKSALAQAVELLPERSLVGFITFGTYVQVLPPLPTTPQRNFCSYVTISSAVSSALLTFGTSRVWLPGSRVGIWAHTEDVCVQRNKGGDQGTDSGAYGLLFAEDEAADRSDSRSQGWAFSGEHCTISGASF